MTERNRSDHLTQVLIVSPDAIDSTVGDETVILHLGNSTYYGLDPIGTVIWEGVKAGRSIAEIRTEILSTYDVTGEVLEADMRRFISELVEHEILVIS